MGAFFPNQAKSFAELCYHNEIERIFWLRSTVPILTFASHTWLPNKMNSATLEKVQKLATRCILGPEKSYYERMKELKLLALSF